MPPVSAPTRRALLGLVGTGGLVAATGCDPGSTRPTSDEGDPPDDPDRALLDEVVRATRELNDLVLATTVLHAGLTTRLAGLAGIHEDHLAALGADPVSDTPPEDAAESGETPAPSDAPNTEAANTETPNTEAPDADPLVPQRPAAALARVLTGERTLATDLGTAAVAAQSGAFARLLAVMAAGVLQQVELLDGADPREQP